MKRMGILASVRLAAIGITIFAAVTKRSITVVPTPAEIRPDARSISETSSRSQDQVIPNIPPQIEFTKPKPIPVAATKIIASSNENRRRGATDFAHDRLRCRRIFRLVTRSVA